MVSVASTTIRGAIMGTGLTILTLGVNIIVNDAYNPGGYFLTFIGFIMVMSKYFIFRKAEEEQ